MSTATTSICRSIMLEIERWRIAVGLPMDKFSEYAGLPERYYAKALHADTPSGRQPRWASVQIMVDALFPGGFDVEIRPKLGAVMTADSLKAKLLQLRAPTDVKTQRELMRALSVKAAEGRKAIPATKRSAIARRAAKARWRTPKIVEITPVRDVPPSSCPTR